MGSFFCNRCKHRQKSGELLHSPLSGYLVVDFDPNFNIYELVANIKP